jgi:hypothetical protein
MGAVSKPGVFPAEIAAFPEDSVHESVAKPKIREDFHSYMNHEIGTIPQGQT